MISDAGKALTAQERKRKSLLEQKRRELQGDLRPRFPEGPAIDSLDRARDYTEREREAARLQKVSRELRAVEDALRRVGKPGDGICQDCCRLIAPARLLAVPEARRCTLCQEDLDRHYDEMERDIRLTDTQRPGAERREDHEL